MIQAVVYAVVVYGNRTDTMRLHQGLNRLGVKNSIMPTPNQISSSCGLSILIRYSEVSKVIHCVNRFGLSQNYQIFVEHKNFNRSLYSKIK